MIVFVGLVLIFQLSTLLLLPVADRKLKFVSKQDIKHVEMFVLMKKSKYFFVFYKRKEGIISKHIYLCMLVYYIINVIGFISISIQLLFDNSHFLTATFIILGHLNLGLLIAVASQPFLNHEQKCRINNYRIEERWK